MPMEQGPSVPNIKVQLVHIEGPLKGQIQEFDDSLITIGRSPECSVVFPGELKAISRKHAEIRREGNRFKLLDHSTNGTFIQGRRIDEAYLRDGDVITFTENGPKVSFLSVVEKVSRQAAEPQAPVEGQGVETPAPPLPGPVKISIQWGAALKTFRHSSVRIGTDSSCELSTDLPGIFPYHLEIRGEQGQVWARDLSGESRTVLNGMPLTRATVLRAGDSLRLADSGPILEYTGEARFVRREISRQEAPPVRPAPVYEERRDLSEESLPGPGADALGPPHGREFPGLPSGIPTWVLVAGGSALLVALIVYLIVKLTG